MDGLLDRPDVVMGRRVVSNVCHNISESCVQQLDQLCSWLGKGRFHYVTLCCLFIFLNNTRASLNFTSLIDICEDWYHILFIFIRVNIATVPLSLWSRHTVCCHEHTLRRDRESCNSDTHSSKQRKKCEMGKLL